MAHDRKMMLVFRVVFEVPDPVTGTMTGIFDALGHRSDQSVWTGSNGFPDEFKLNFHSHPKTNNTWAIGAISYIPNTILSHQHYNGPQPIYNPPPPPLSSSPPPPLLLPPPPPPPSLWSCLYSQQQSLVGYQFPSWTSTCHCSCFIYICQTRQ